MASPAVTFKAAMPLFCSQVRTSLAGSTLMDLNEYERARQNVEADRVLKVTEPAG
jgi:hypothetical protein